MKAGRWPLRVDGGPSFIVSKSAAVGGERSFNSTHRGVATPTSVIRWMRVTGAIRGH